MPDTPHPTNVTPPVGSTPTSSSTTSVIIPSTPTVPQSQRGFAEWDNVVILFVGIVGLISLVSMVLGMVEKATNFFDRRKKKDKEDDGPLIERVNKVESDIKAFRKSEEIDKDLQFIKNDIRHIKSNMAATGDAADHRFRKVEGDVNNIRTDLARLETKTDGMNANFERVETAVDRLAERMETRLDNIQQSLLSRALPAGRRSSTD